MLRLPTPTSAFDALTEAELSGLKAFIHAQAAPYRAAWRPSQADTCHRDGHRPVARWRGQALRCFRCTRCGQETQP